ncbi:hypothetical protein Tsubulata_003920 [Turnera subulata]|uniref:Transmembrane protein n=1 Tax=Turnera subulata TaxID=218843 RepID=A0A9Q0GI02_9ROSI|nr:hypothetical protein Tsubulata_003920 [Turnera subulata]
MREKKKNEKDQVQNIFEPKKVQRTQKPVLLSHACSMVATFFSVILRRLEVVGRRFIKVTKNKLVKFKEKKKNPRNTSFFASLFLQYSPFQDAVESSYASHFLTCGRQQQPLLLVGVNERETITGGSLQVIKGREQKN